MFRITRLLFRLSYFVSDDVRKFYTNYLNFVKISKISWTTWTCTQPSGCIEDFFSRDLVVSYSSSNSKSLTLEAIVLWVRNDSRVSKINSICKLVLLQTARFMRCGREKNSRLRRDVTKQTSCVVKEIQLTIRRRMASLDRPTLTSNQFSHPPLEESYLSRWLGFFQL